VPTIRLQSTVVERVLDYEWHIGRPIDPGMGDPLPSEFFASLPAVDHANEQPRFELLTVRHVNIAAQYRGLRGISIETGTAPTSGHKELAISHNMISDFPILGFWGALIFERSIFDRVQRFIVPEFFFFNEYTIY